MGEQFRAYPPPDFEGVEVEAGPTPGTVVITVVNCGESVAVTLSVATTHALGKCLHEWYEPRPHDATGEE